MIYYVADIELSRVKIGYTTPSHLKSRMSNIKTNNSSHIYVVGSHSGTRDKEKVIHRKLQDDHFSGEWYHLDHRVINYIEEANDFEYFFDVFENEIKEGVFSNHVFERMIQEYHRQRAMIILPFGKTLTHWLEYMQSQPLEVSSNWRNIVPPDLFKETPMYIWGKSDEQKY